MHDADQLLEQLEEGIVAHGGDLGGWTRRFDDTLQIFDGRVSLRVEVHDPSSTQDAGIVHAHVFTTLHEHDDEVLDACVIGLGNERESAIGQAAVVWISCVAGPIKSFLDNRPVCMTCQAGAAAESGSSDGDYGLSGLRAYVGPSIARGFDDHAQVQAAIDDTKPWFRFAAESAAPRRVHLAKATILSEGKAGWRRELEIDGHDVSHVDRNWPAGITGPEFGYLTRYAVFEFPSDSPELVRRAELERTIRHFAANFAAFDSVDSLQNSMVEQGFDADLVHEAESFATIAFGRLFFERFGVQYSPTIIRARSNGRIEADVPLMSLPAYCRGRAIGASLGETLSDQAFQALCLYNAESNAILQLMEAAGTNADFSRLKIHPSIVPDRNVTDQTMDNALSLLHSMIRKNQSGMQKTKPWWKFW